ncbi:Aste57867_12159 [Aphanomyces stellatus]|uniref:Aste57867_12159 protein n=1 Tax=Aphanomyces stellatus TaxID=120398 RepID=A0A485KUT7_9STRA|nr:hypothetical protein As57867_012114 [Aphanomyces stellatus]VFT89013.1 Aste57867_12159 [Aphanomyces stellatus]
MSQPPPPRPSGAPPPRPNGAPPPRPGGSPPPRPAGAPPPRPAGPPANSNSPPPRAVGAPPGSPPKSVDAPPKPVEAPPPKPAGAPPPRPAGAPPPRPLAPPPTTEPPAVITEPPPTTQATSSPPKPDKPPIRPPPGAPPPSNLIANGTSPPKIAPPPGMPPPTIAPPAGPPPPKGGSPIKPPAGAPSPIKPPAGAPPIKPPAGAPPIKPPAGAPPLKPPPGEVPGPPKGAPPGPPGPPKGAPPGPPKGAPPGPPKGAPPSPPKGDAPAGSDANDKGDDAAPAAIIAPVRSLMKKGRMHFKLLEAKGLCKPPVKKDAKHVFKADVYCKLKVGAKSKAVKEAKSKTWKKSGQDVGFQEETIWINLDKPDTMLTPDRDCLVTVEVWDENMIADEMLGTCDVSMLRFMDGATHVETIPLSHQKTRTPAGTIVIEFVLEIATPGMLSLVVMEGRNLKNMELVGKQDPYCKFEHNALTKRTKTIDKGGTNPYFGEEEVCFWITGETWVHDMIVKLFDEDVGSDDFIGEGKISVLAPMQVLGQSELRIPLTNGGKAAGELLVKIEFFPAGHLVIRCLAGRKLRDVDTVGRQDPYLKLSLEGACIKTNCRTEVDNDGGKEPEWDQPFDFDVVDQFNMVIECWDHDNMGDDDLIGELNLSLLPIFRYGYLDEWYPLAFHGKFGSTQKAGELHLELSFVAPQGILYPQHQVGMETFNEKERLTKETQHLRVTDAIKPIEVASSLEIVKQAKAFVAADNKSEFSEEDILGAFKFIDLDKNTFIGAAELRHILICMGELITDAEVDEMVRMVDRDGDGQVSFEEFRKMAVHPDPGSLEFGKDDDVAPANEVNEHADVVTDEDRKREMEIKMQKKALVDRFIGDNNVNLDMLRRVFGRFLKTEKAGLSFEDFYTLFEVEPTGEYRKLHGLYAGEKLADIREILLGMSNLLDVDKVMKAQFVFEIYDDDHNGYITEDELINILKATHMTTAANVMKKAKTILKQADSDGDNKIDLAEFHVISKKFPNIIFPHIG